MASAPIVTVNQADVQVGPAERRIVVKVRNASDNSERYRLELQDVPGHWQPGWAYLTPAELEIGPREDGRAQIVLAPPRDVTATQFTLTVWAIPQSGAAGRGYARLRVTVAGGGGTVYGPDIVTPPETRSMARLLLGTDVAVASLLPGDTTELEAFVENTSDAADTVELDLEGLPEEWVQILPRVLNLWEWQRDHARIRIRPPEERTATKAGVYPAVLRVASRRYAGREAEKELRFDIPLIGDYHAELEPEEVRGASEARLTLIVHNHGNAPLLAHWHGIDNTYGLTLDFAQPEAEIQPGERASVGVTVHAPHTSETERVLEVRILVEGEYLLADEGAVGRAPHEVSARFIQRPLPPLALTIQPAEVFDPRAGEFEVQVTGPSSAMVTAELAAEDPQGHLDFAFDPPRVLLRPGRPARSSLRVESRVRVAAGERQERSFRVTASTPGSDFRPATATARLIQFGLRDVPYTILATGKTPALIIFLLDVSRSMATELDGRPRIDLVMDHLHAEIINMVHRSTKSGLVSPRYNVAILAYSDEVEDVLGGVKTVQELADRSKLPRLAPLASTQTAKAFAAAEKLLRRELPRLGERECPAPLICHMTDGEYTGDDPEPIVRRIMQMCVPDGHVLVENVFISDTMLPRPIKDPTRWRGILPDTRLTNDYAVKLREMSSELPASYREMMAEQGYDLDVHARMMLPGTSADLVDMAFQMAAATPIREAPGYGGGTGRAESETHKWPWDLRR